MNVRARPFVFTALASLFFSPIVDAAPQRTFVSAAGNDALPCSLTRPCRSFGVAVAAVASGGEVIALDTAGYGPVTIAKSVSIVAPTGIHAGISVPSGSDGITVNAPGATVVLRGLTINGLGGRWGVYLQNGARLRIEGCVISNMAQDGVNHVAAGAELVMLDTIVRDNGSFGISVAADASIVLDHVRSEHNQVGLGIVAASSTASATVTDSVFSHNVGAGVVADANIGTKSYVQVERSVMSNNGLGFQASTAHPSAEVHAMLARNAINRNGGDGILLGDATGGYVEAYVSENAVHANSAGVRVHRGAVFASANIIGSNFFDVSCDAGQIFAYGNNVISSLDENGCSLHGNGY